MAFTYKNYKGETAERRATIAMVRFGSNEYHREPQWLADAFDLDKGKSRTFALRDMSHVRLFAVPTASMLH